MITRCAAVGFNAVAVLPTLHLGWLPAACESEIARCVRAAGEGGRETVEWFLFSSRLVGLFCSPQFYTQAGCS